MQGYLDAGYTAAQVRTVLELKRGKKAVSANMLRAALEQHVPLAPAPRASEPGKPNVPAAPQRHPDFDRWPEWRTLPIEEQVSINMLLLALDNAGSAESQRRIRFNYDQYRDYFVRVARKRPELWDIIGSEADALRLRSG